MNYKLVRVALILFIFSLMFVSVSFSQKGKESPDEVEMVLRGVLLDQQMQTPVVLLTDKENKRVIPIWIGLCEARSIEIGHSNTVMPRPFTYDLLAAIVRTMNAKIDRVRIIDLRDGVFYAQVEVSFNGKVSKIDARPSDAIALATRLGVPIFVRKSLLEKVKTMEHGDKKRGA